MVLILIIGMCTAGLIIQMLITYFKIQKGETPSEVEETPQKLLRNIGIILLGYLLITVFFSMTTCR